MALVLFTSLVVATTTVELASLPSSPSLVSSSSRSARTTSTDAKWGSGVYNDTLRASPFYAQIPAACNLTGRGGWVLLFFETVDGGAAVGLPATCTDQQTTSGNEVCGCQTDGSTLQLECVHGGTIASVQFASIGTPTGVCGNMSAGACAGDPTLAREYVEQQCVGKQSCALSADINTFNHGKDPCVGVKKSIAVELICSNSTPPSPAPPKPALPEQWQVDALTMAVACGLRPIIRLGQRNRNYRYYADTSAFDSYARLGERYASFVRGLLSGADIRDPSSIVVQVNNEVNVCVEWECWEGPSTNISAVTMAREWAAFTQDVLAALAPIGVQLAAAPLAAGGAAVCQCTTGPTFGHAGSWGGMSAAGFLTMALEQRPSLFANATYFAGHPYPANCNEPLNSSVNLPVEMGGNSTWMADVKDNRMLAMSSWVKNVSHDHAAGANGTAFRLLATETGWCGSNENGKAAWICQAFTELWNKDPVVAAVIPFLLAGHHWDVEGFTWTRWGGSQWDVLQLLEPQYLAVQKLSHGGTVEDLT